VATGFLIEIKSAIRCIGSFDELIKMSMQCWSLTAEKGRRLLRLNGERDCVIQPHPHGTGHHHE
jgi:hypothetical protein